MQVGPIQSVEDLNRTKRFTLPWIEGIPSAWSPFKIVSVTFQKQVRWCNEGGGLFSEVYSPQWNSVVTQLIKNLPGMQEIPLDSWGRKIHWRKDRLPTPIFLGFPNSSAGKESAYNVGDLCSFLYKKIHITIQISARKKTNKQTTKQKIQACQECNYNSHKNQNGKNVSSICEREIIS